MHETQVPIVTYVVERYDGECEVLLWGKKRMGVRTQDLTINGVHYHFVAELELGDDCKWVIRRDKYGHPDYRAVFGSRNDNYKEPTSSARSKFIDLAIDIANWCAEEKPDALLLGEIRTLNREIDRAQDDARKARSALQIANKQLDEAVERREAVLDFYSKVVRAKQSITNE